MEKTDNSISMNNGTYMAIYRNKIKEKPERYI